MLKRFWFINYCKNIYVFQNCSEYLDLAQSQGNKWQKMLYNERRQRIQLVEMVDQIAREQTVLEHVANNDKQGK